MQTEVESGICPACESAGWIGAPCADERCRRRGYHLIPIEYFDRDARVPDPLIGQMWDNYLLVRRLGEGGVGAVYLALQQPIGLRTALKVLHARQGRQSALAERFSSEAAALARLVHPNIVRLLGAGSVAERPYIAMEYIDGARTLADEMRSGMDLEAVRRVLLQVIDALDSAHATNVIHRDIKPANIMLQATGRESHFVRLVDFGLVKFTDDGDSTQLAAGTPVYMAPEQVRRSDIGPWTDWYAVGVMALEMITGRRPFPKVASHVLLQLKMVGEVDPFEPMADIELPPAVRRLVGRTTATDPRARPQSVGEMAELIEAAFAELRARSAHPLPLAAPLPSSGSQSLPLSGSGSGSGPASLGPSGVPQPRPGGRRGLWAGLLVLAVLGGLGSWWLVAGGDEPAVPAVVDAAVAAPDAAPDVAVVDAAVDVAVDVAVDAAVHAAPPDAAPPRPPPRRVRTARPRPAPRKPATAPEEPATAPERPAPVPPAIDIEEL